MTCPHCDWSANLRAIKRAAFGLCPRCDEKSDRHIYSSGSHTQPVLVRNPLVCSRCLHDWLRRNVTGRVLGRCYRMNEAPGIPTGAASISPALFKSAMEKLKRDAHKGNTTPYPEGPYYGNP